MTSRKKVYLHQFVHLFGSEAWIPLSVGLIAAHARTSTVFNEHFQIEDFRFRRESPEVIVDGYEEPYLLAFSTYIWNIQLSLEVAKRAKERYPNVKILFGGPSAPTNAGAAEVFLRKHPFIDLLASNEGETTFLEYCEALAAGKALSQVQGLYQLVDGKYVPSTPRPFTKNMDHLASPYLDNTFDHIMGKGVKFHAIWETSRGCPFRCGFCYWGDVERSKKAQAGPERLEKEMDWFSANKVELLYIADSNFGWLERDMATAQGLVRRSLETGYPKKVMLTWAKNANEKCFEVAKVLQKANLCFPITMSYQSLDDTALKNIQRSNITLDRSKALRQKYRENKMSTYTDLLVGIPGETLESFTQGVEKTIEYGEHDQIQIYQIRILPNTEMAVPEYIEKHKIKTIWVPLQSKHGALNQGTDVQEMEEMIIETSSMPLADWKKQLELTWFTQAFFCLKLSYFVNLFLKDHLKLKITDFGNFLIDEVKKDAGDHFPHLYFEILRLQKFIEDYSRGNPHVDVSDIDLPKVTWPIEEATFIKLSLNRSEFYEELREITNRFLTAWEVSVDAKLLDEVFAYQKARIINPSGPANTELQFTYNLPEFFEAAMLLNPISLRSHSNRLTIEKNYDYKDLKEFAQFHVWYGRQGKHFYYKVQLDGRSSFDEMINLSETETAVPAIST